MKSMKVVKKLTVGFLAVILSFLAVLVGIIWSIGLIIVTKIWLITLVLMSILKISGLITIPWFAGIFTPGAISTSLWLLLLGIIMIAISLSIILIGNIFIEKLKRPQR